MTENFKKLIRSYEILALKLGKASLNDIQETYRYLVKVWHPDRFGHDPKLQHIAQEKMKEINEAYQTIQDARKNPHKYGISDDGFYKEPNASDQQEQQANTTAPPPPPPPTSPPPAPPPSNPNKKDERLVRPWVRLFARLFDYYLFLLCLFLLLILIGMVIGGSFPPALENVAYVYIVAYISGFMWIYLESALLTTYGTTPGKWMFGTTVRDSNGRNPVFSEALSRSFSVWFRGLGMNIPIVTFITQLVAYVNLKEHGITTWDRNGKFIITHKKIGTVRVVVIIMFFILSSSLFTLLQTVATEQEKTATKPRDIFDSGVSAKPSLEEIFRNVKYGTITVFTDYQYGPNDIYINDVYVGQLNSYFSDNYPDPECKGKGTVSKVLLVGEHKIYAKNSNGTVWPEFTFYIKEGECRIVKLSKPSPTIIYKYIDDSGTVSFTDNLEKIPKKFRAKAETIENRWIKDDTPKIVEVGSVLE